MVAPFTIEAPFDGVFEINPFVRSVGEGWGWKGFLLVERQPNPNRQGRRPRTVRRYTVGHAQPEFFDEIAFDRLFDGEAGADSKKNAVLADVTDAAELDEYAQKCQAYCVHPKNQSPAPVLRVGVRKGERLVVRSYIAWKELSVSVLGFPRTQHVSFDPLPAIDLGAMNTTVATRWGILPANQATWVKRSAGQNSKTFEWFDTSNDSRTASLCLKPEARQGLAPTVLQTYFYVRQASYEVGSSRVQIPRWPVKEIHVEPAPFPEPRGEGKDRKEYVPAAELDKGRPSRVVVADRAGQSSRPALQLRDGQGNVQARVPGSLLLRLPQRSQRNENEVVRMLLNESRLDPRALPPAMLDDARNEWFFTYQVRDLDCEDGKLVLDRVCDPIWHRAKRVEEVRVVLGLLEQHEAALLAADRLGPGTSSERLSELRERLKKEPLLLLKEPGLAAELELSDIRSQLQGWELRQEQDQIAARLDALEGRVRSKMATALRLSLSGMAGPHPKGIGAYRDALPADQAWLRQAADAAIETHQAIAEELERTWRTLLPGVNAPRELQGAADASGGMYDAQALMPVPPGELASLQVTEEETQRLITKAKASYQALETRLAELEAQPDAPQGGLPQRERRRWLARGWLDFVLEKMLVRSRREAEEQLETVRSKIATASGTPESLLVRELNLRIKSGLQFTQETLYKEWTPPVEGTSAHARRVRADDMPMYTWDELLRYWHADTPTTFDWGALHGDAEHPEEGSEVLVTITRRGETGAIYRAHGKLAGIGLHEPKDVQGTVPDGQPCPCRRGIAYASCCKRFNERFCEHHGGGHDFRTLGLDLESVDLSLVIDGHPYSLVFECPNPPAGTDLTLARDRLLDPEAPRNVLRTYLWAEGSPFVDGVFSSDKLKSDDDGWQSFSYDEYDIRIVRTDLPRWREADLLAFNFDQPWAKAQDPGRLGPGGKLRLPAQPTRALDVTWGVVQRLRVILELDERVFDAEKDVAQVDPVEKKTFAGYPLHVGGHVLKNGPQSLMVFGYLQPHESEDKRLSDSKRNGMFVEDHLRIGFGARKIYPTAAKDEDLKKLVGTGDAGADAYSVTRHYLGAKALEQRTSAVGGVHTVDWTVEWVSREGEGWEAQGSPTWEEGKQGVAYTFDLFVADYHTPPWQTISDQARQKGEVVYDPDPTTEEDEERRRKQAAAAGGAAEPEPKEQTEAAPSGGESAVGEDEPGNVITTVDDQGVVRRHRVGGQQRKNIAGRLQIGVIALDDRIQALMDAARLDRDESSSALPVDDDLWNHLREYHDRPAGEAFDAALIALWWPYYHLFTGRLYEPAIYGPIDLADVRDEIDETIEHLKQVGKPLTRDLVVEHLTNKGVTAASLLQTHSFSEDPLQEGDPGAEARAMCRTWDRAIAALRVCLRYAGDVTPDDANNGPAHCFTSLDVVAPDGMYLRILPAVFASALNAISSDNALGSYFIAKDKVEEAYWDRLMALLEERVEQQAEGEAAAQLMIAQAAQQLLDAIENESSSPMLAIKFHALRTVFRVVVMCLGGGLDAEKPEGKREHLPAFLFRVFKIVINKLIKLTSANVGLSSLSQTKVNDLIEDKFANDKDFKGWVEDGAKKNNADPAKHKEELKKAGLGHDATGNLFDKTPFKPGGEGHAKGCTYEDLVSGKDGRKQRRLDTWKKDLEKKLHLDANYMRHAEKIRFLALFCLELSYSWSWWWPIPFVIPLAVELRLSTSGAFNVQYGWDFRFEFLQLACLRRLMTANELALLKNAGEVPEKAKDQNDYSFTPQSEGQKTPTLIVVDDQIYKGGRIDHLEEAAKLGILDAWGIGAQEFTWDQGRDDKPTLLQTAAGSGEREQEEGSHGLVGTLLLRGDAKLQHDAYSRPLGKESSWVDWTPEQLGTLKNVDMSSLLRRYEPGKGMLAPLLDPERQTIKALVEQERPAKADDDWLPDTLRYLIVARRHVQQLMAELGSTALPEDFSVVTDWPIGGADRLLQEASDLETLNGGSHLTFALSRVWALSLAFRPMVCQLAKSAEEKLKKDKKGGRILKLLIKALSFCDISITGAARILTTGVLSKDFVKDRWRGGVVVRPDISVTFEAFFLSVGWTIFNDSLLSYDGDEVKTYPDALKEWDVDLSVATLDGMGS